MLYTDSDTVGAFTYHDLGTPPMSKDQYNIAKDSGDVQVSQLRNIFIITHGALMLVAWPVLSFTAIFFAAWMKPALPNGQWFQVIFLSSSLTLMALKLLNI